MGGEIILAEVAATATPSGLLDRIDPVLLAAAISFLSLSFVVLRTVRRIRRRDRIDRKLILKLEAQARHEVVRDAFSELRMRRNLSAVGAE